VNGLTVDFWLLGVIAWLVFWLLVWLITWLICCLLGLVLCRCLAPWLRVPPHPHPPAPGALGSPEPHQGPWPHHGQAILSPSPACVGSVSENLLNDGTGGADSERGELLDVPG
jgi:hypothetical protein